MSSVGMRTQNSFHFDPTKSCLTVVKRPSSHPSQVNLDQAAGDVGQNRGCNIIPSEESEEGEPYAVVKAHVLYRSSS
jgi:hypothetical protein